MDTYMLQKIYDIFSIPVYVIMKSGEIFQIPENEIYQSPFSKDENLRKDIIKAAEVQEQPFLYLEDEMIYYGIFSDKRGNCCLFGPMARKNLDHSAVEAYRYAHKIRTKFEIIKCGFDIASKMLAMVYYHYTGIEIAHSDVMIDSRSSIAKRWEPEQDMEHYQLEQSEEDRRHNSIDYENRILQIVRNGDVNAMKELMNGDQFDAGDIGVVALDNQKQTEYLMVSFITLITRAAIDGGLNPEKAYELGDVYLQQIEKCRSAEEITMIGIKAQFDITNQVNEAKNLRSRLVYIEDCKDYIAKHLRKPFKVGDIAPAIGVNRTYLAKKFSEVEGMTIQQYIMQERCRHAANLLKYSNYPISIISEYFCFSSQSHFGVQFRKVFGVTPNEYRNQNRYIGNYNDENQKSGVNQR